MYSLFQHANFAFFSEISRNTTINFAYVHNETVLMEIIRTVNVANSGFEPEFPP